MADAETRQRDPGGAAADTVTMIFEKRMAIQSEKGFTLLETLVAVTLVAMMAVAMWSIFRTSIRAWSHGIENIDANQRQRNILDMVRKQLASAYPLIAPLDWASPSATHLIFYGTETRLSFISLNSLRFHDSPGLTLVNYEVIQDPQGAFTLYESEEPYLGRIPDPESEIDLAGITPLFDNLVQCHFEYRGLEGEEPWVREWDAVERGQLPEAVAVNIVAVDTDGNTRSHQIILPIYAGSRVPLAAVRNSVSNDDEDEENLGRRSEFIRRRKLERERKQ